MLTLNAPTQPLSLRDRYHAVRRQTEHLCEPLAVEDYCVQTMADVSPTKWHLAHTSWFWERFLLLPELPGYVEHHPAYSYLFNSYYVTVGARHCRVARGTISRPTVADVYAYRAYVDRHMDTLLERLGDELPPRLRYVFDVGINHEQQHQELMLTDLKHVFGCNPIYPAYTAHAATPTDTLTPASFTAFEEGVRQIGHRGDGFAYDNECPRHKAYVNAFELADRAVSNGEFIRFIEDNGYARPDLWLSDGAATVKRDGWDAPFYWEKRDGQWHSYTLAGLRPINPDEPMLHASYFEADAFARWANRTGVYDNARLPTEFEWEAACVESDASPADGQFVDDRLHHPRPMTSEAGLRDLFGTVWEWTSSQYSPYPGYAPPDGALGEYNGKFMCNQFVLRGGSLATPRDHIRATYRNFFPPDARWQFSGFRLARDA